MTEDCTGRSFAEKCARDVVEALRMGGLGKERLCRPDLLRGVLEGKDTRGARMLQALGVDRAAMATRLGGVRGQAASEGLLSPQLILAIDWAAAEAAREGTDSIDSAHVLVGLARGTRAGHDLHRDPTWMAARLVTAWTDGKVSLWDLATPRGPLTLDAGRPVHCVAADPDWSHVAAGGDDGRLDLWDLPQGVHVRFPHGHKGAVRAVAWSPKAGHVLSGSEDGTAIVWDASSGTVDLELAGHDGPVRTVAWSPKGTRMFTGSDDATIRIWRAKDGRLIEVRRGHHASVVKLAFLKAGVPLVSRAQDDEAILWTKPPQRHAAPADELAPVFGACGLTAARLRERLATTPA